MGQKGTSCNVTIQFQIQIIHAIWLAYGWTMELSLPVEYVVMTSTTLEWHWLWMEETQHTKKNYSSWCLKKPFVNSTCHWISPRTLTLFFYKKLKPQKFQERNFVMIYMTLATIEKLLKRYFWNWLGHSWLQILFLTTTHELAHFNGKEFEKINNDIFKHFPQWLNYCSKGVTTK